jgi:serine protease AprX
VSNREANGTQCRWAGCATSAARPGSWRRSFLRRSLAGSVASLMLAVTGLAITAVPASADGYDPTGDMNSMANTTLYSGAAAWWNAGYTGAGVDVALIDTGVTPVPGLDAPGKVIYGPDLSLESQAPNLTRLDTNGHGTFMAGLIAGRDSTLSAPYSSAPASAYRGEAPGARIVSVKVGVADGGVDVSQVIAAIDWVVQHRNDNGMNIRVINLSYGTNSLQDYAVDPLAYAAEQAWRKGIVVVAAGGNLGFQSHMNNAPALADPAFDPNLLAVGSSDSMGTPSMADDQVTSFSPWPKRGATRGVDLIAPGAHLQGLRVPGSYIDQNNPDGAIDDRYFRGSGTSESAALVSGAAALVLQKYPDATPDQVKRLLTGTGYRVSGKAQAIGGGELQLTKALNTPLPAGTVPSVPALGVGSLEGSRGDDHLSDDGVVLSGEQDIFGQPFDTVAMAPGTAAGNTWSGGVWNGNTWSGNTWSGNTWSGAVWSGNSWSGNTWSGNTWSGNTWSGNTWSGNTWSGNSWSGNTWSGNSWSTNIWAGDSWQGATWG